MNNVTAAVGTSDRRPSHSSMRTRRAVVRGRLRKANSLDLVFVAGLALLLWLGGIVVTPQAYALDPRRSLTEYGRKQWGPEDGLPCYSILSVVQSSDGYLWLGTEEGLVRFDGLRAKVFDETSNPELGNSFIFVAAPDPLRPGSLLVGNYSGVFSFRGDSARPFATAAQTTTATAAGLASVGRTVRAVNRDESDGTLWVGTSQGLFCICPDGRILGPDEAAGRPQAPVFALCRDGAGRLCVGTAQGLFRQGKPRRGELGGFERVPALGKVLIYCLAPSPDGSLWVGTREGAGRLREDTFLPRPELTGRSITCLREDRAGMLWAGSSGSGLYRLAAADGAPGATVLTTAQGLVGDVVRDLCEDREGNLWVATTTGLQVLRDVRFTTLGRPEGLASECVWTVWEDSTGRLWIGGEGGLNSVEPTAATVARTTGPTGAAADNVRVTNYPVPGLPTRPGDYTINCVGSDEGFDSPGPGARGRGLLAGSREGLLRLRDGALKRLRIHDDLDRENISGFCTDSTGAVWVGCHNGVYLLRHQTVLAHYTMAGGELPSNLVTAVHPDQRGNLWIATEGGLVRRDSSGRFTNFAHSGGLLAGEMHCLYEDPASGDLFVGSADGLLRLRPQESGEVKATQYAVRDGLLDNKVWNVLADGAGNLWMSFNKGVSRLALADLTRFDRREIASIPAVSYGVADGMRSRECNGGCQPGGWRDHAGQLWFATARGAVCVDPVRALKLNPLPPPVQVEELLADGRLVIPTAGGRPPELPAGTQRLDFRYTALSFSAPEANHLRYWLEGYEQGWRDAGTERAAHYTNLAPGNYTFRVQAANADGIWNETGANLSFRLRPFFYQTGWFRLLSVTSVLGVGWLWLRRHKRHLVARLAQAEAEVAARARTQEILRQAKEVAESARTEAESARTEAEVAQTEAERASQAKSEFLSRVSHELRTPLNAILGFGQLLELDELNPSQKQSVGHILGGGRHLLGLVNEVLDLARIERGEMAVRPEDVDLGPLLAEIVGLMNPLARERAVRLHLEESAGAMAAVGTARVYADPQLLRQILLNLVANAIKYNRPVGGEVFISVGMPPSPALTPQATGAQTLPHDRLRLTVRDSGIGIGAEDLAKLFTPFERLGAAYGPIKGTGLGLAVSKQFVESMGGMIGVESVPGAGSTFWVELPLRAAPVIQDARTGAFSTFPPESGEDPSPETLTTGEVTGATSATPTLLYVEDNAANRDLVAHLLGTFRPELRLLLAHDAEKGLAMARRVPRPDFILLDLNLPGLSGEAALAQLRADPYTATIPVIILSGDATARTRERHLATGARAYLTKPFNVQRFLALMNELLPSPAWSEEVGAGVPT